MTFDASDDFPILKQATRGKRLGYLDSGATTQKPQAVIDAITHYYTYQNANVHRGLYALSEDATQAYDAAREVVRQFIHAPSSREIIFTSGTTASINLVAHSFGRAFIQPGDEILISAMEHHANIVPWQLMAEQTGAKLNVVPVLSDGTLDQAAYDAALRSGRVKLVALVHVSNVLGTINPVKSMIARAHAADVPVLLDGAQAVAHLPVDVQDLDCDFYAFSGHKLYGPMGIGVLYAKSKWLSRMPPYQGGGDMIRQVTFEKTEYAELPTKFEAGTPNAAGVMGLRAAIAYIQSIGWDAIKAHEQALSTYTREALLRVPGLRLIGTAPEKIGVFSFVMDAVHPHDIATILADEGVAIRAGHHCAMPLIRHFGLPATARVSLGIYNTQADIDQLMQALAKVCELFGVSADVI